MPSIKEHPAQEAVSIVWQGRNHGGLRRSGGALLPRLDFRHVSSHLSQKRPGFYLILLRNEIRHRTLREKPALTD
jgi:hypothetical protein